MLPPPGHAARLVGVHIEALRVGIAYRHGEYVVALPLCHDAEEW